MYWLLSKHDRVETHGYLVGIIEMCTVQANELEILQSEYNVRVCAVRD